MKFYNDFIGLDESNSSKNFQGGDLEETFIESLKTQPDDWYYRTVEITYLINDYGHRCKSVKELDFDNYILISGCSHTQGVGLELEKTYPYLLSKKLDCDYYNMGLPATGIDVVEHNIVTWLFKYPKKPKAIIIQWPDYTRFLSNYPGYPTLIPNGSWTDDTFSKKLISAGDVTGIFNARKKLCSNNIKNAAQNIALVTFNYGGQTPVDEQTYFFRRLDLARDLSHSGIKSHENITNSVLEILKPNPDK